MTLIGEKEWNQIHLFLDIMNLPHKEIGKRTEKHIVLLYRSTQIHIVPGDDNILFVADVIEGVQETPELYRYLLTDAAKPFGNVSVNSGRIFISYSLPIGTLDFNIFATILFQFSMYADWLDDKVKKRFGGKRIADLLEEIRKEDNSRRRTIGFHPTE